MNEDPGEPQLSGNDFSACANGEPNRREHQNKTAWPASRDRFGTLEVRCAESCLAGSHFCLQATSTHINELLKSLKRDGLCRQADYDLEIPRQENRLPHEALQSHVRVVIHPSASDPWPDLGRYSLARHS